MDNPLSKYINQNLTACISGLEVVSGTSKEGRTYYAVELSFINGYKKRLFLSNDETFAWCNAFDTLSAKKIIEDNFSED